MSSIAVDPIPAGHLSEFARQLRAGSITSVQATQAYLNRIKALDPNLQAYQRVDEDKALATARAMDDLLAAGTDLGPLMGVPIAIKDVFVMDGYPMPTAGSRADLSDVLGDRQGAFIDALRRCGVIILGVTKTVEFCLGITGVSEPLGTPRNPWDADRHRVPGGSSSGSAAATAAGMCAFAIGTDTGGSVRVPAAFNGLFGLKTTFGRWPTQGAAPLDPTIDTIGLLTKSAMDAKLAFDTLEARLFGHAYTPSTWQADVNGLRIGRPETHFYEDLSPEVDAAVSDANARLEQAGALFKSVEITETSERTGYFPLAMPAHVVSMLGKEGFERARPDMDPVIGKRVAEADHILASDLLAAMKKRQHSIETAKRYFDAVEVIGCPTTAIVAPPLDEFDDLDRAMDHALGMTRNTQPSNYLGQCAVSLPLPRPAGALPIGYQLIGAPDADARLLDIALAIEALFGVSKPAID